MLISRVEEMSEASEHEYRTASELFNRMAGSQSFGDLRKSLPTSDFVILYKNIDLGTKLTPNSEELELAKEPNRRVETIVYEDDSESDDEIYSCEDIHDVLTINEERIDMFNSQPSFSDTLCQKLGDLEIQASNLSRHHFNGIGSAVPPSLLDYLCCQSPEDNNSYMDNVIGYVKHTIEHLERISNGDYLTDRARNKWREVVEAPREGSTKVLATTTSIPSQVGKVNEFLTTWNDVVQSEVDIRSLSKILDKKIIEIPKVISGSYELFSKLCLEKLAISCKQRAPEESRVEVMVQFGSEPGDVVSNFCSVVVLQATPAVFSVEYPKILPLQFNQSDEAKEEDNVKIVEIPVINEDTDEFMIDEYYEGAEESDVSQEMVSDETPTDDMNDDANLTSVLTHNNSVESQDSSVHSKEINTRTSSDILYKEAPFNVLPLDDLSISMHTFNLDCLPEEEISEDPYPINKKKSQPKVRLKSPYESKSYAMEEKKRRKLLEIREKREKRKLTIGANCKIGKYRHAKGANAPQPSSSVTKLSISNKSFYDSIYGNVNDRQFLKCKGRRNKRELAIETIPLNREPLMREVDTPLTPETEIEKCINRYNLLDEAEITTTLSHLETSANSCAGDTCFPTLSAMSSDFSADTKNISNITNLTESNSFSEKKDFDEQDQIRIITTSSRSSLNVPVPVNSPEAQRDDNSEHSKQVLSSLECKKSIDPLYRFMKKYRKINYIGQKSCNGTDSRSKHEISTVLDNDSGTNLAENIVVKNTAKNKTDALTAVVPKVIISTKQPIVKLDVERPKKDNKKIVLNPLHKSNKSDNPLKAISELLHEFDSIQKTRQKPPTDPKPYKKPEMAFESRSVPRQGPLTKRSRSDQPGREREMKGNEVETKNYKASPLTVSKTQNFLKASKISHISHEKKRIDRAAKKITDLMDEAKEAKGEPVRGPSKISRLDSLAQPKRLYVQARKEEYQGRYGRSLVGDRMPRLATPQPATTRPRPMPTPPVQHLERAPRLRPNSGHEGRAPPELSCKQSHADPPSSLKIKMVAVESYVKSHYGRSSPTSEPEARIPLVPADIDLSFAPSSPSGAESSKIGGKLHHVINSMVKPPQPLSALLEAQETSSLASKEKEFLLDFQEPGSSVDYDFRYILEDNVKTAVESFTPVAEVDSKSLVKYEGSCEIRELEETLRGRISMTSLKERMRIKKLTLTPKHSRQKILESGGSDSVVTSKSLKNHCSVEDATIRSLVHLSDHFNWNLTLPMRVATVAYAFPEYNTAFTRPNPMIKSLDNIFNFGITTNCSSVDDDRKSHKSNKYSNGVPKSWSKLETQEQTVVSEKTIKNATPVLPNEDKELTVGSVVDTDHSDAAKCEICPNITNVNKFTLADTENVKVKPQDIDCASSLDMLVGILNEIQKITACHITNTNIFANEHECNELETLLCNSDLNETAKCNNPLKLVSIASLDKQRQLESSTSIYSLHLSDGDSIANVYIPRMNSEKSVLCDNRSYFVDKEVSANFPARDLTSTFTDVRSAFFPMITHGTNVTDSLFGILSKPSSQTIMSFDYDDLGLTFDRKKRIIEITEDQLNKRPLIECNTGVDGQMQDYKCVQSKTNDIRKGRTEMILFSNHSKYIVKGFDPMIRMKRDILLTVYSMLVLTVFAAITFPEILYHV